MTNRGYCLPATPKGHRSHLAQHRNTYAFVYSFGYISFFFELGKIGPINHISTIITIQFVEANVTGWIQYTVSLSNKKPARCRDGLNHQRHLPRFRKEIVMQPGVVMGKKNTHAWVGVIPSNDFLTFVIRIDLIVDIHQAVLGKGQVNTPLPRIASRQGMLDNNKLLVILVHTPLTYKNTADLVLHITYGMDTDAAVCRLCHKDRYERIQAGSIV